MSVKKSYNRYFIIFQEEDKGYGIAIDKQPTGYTKIENRNGRCKITVYAQNLLRERGPYTCCLVDATKDPAVFAKLGQINIDETGRGETWWEFKEDDIADTGVSFDRFNVAAVITDENKINAPLAGYIGKDRITWKDKIPLMPRTIVKEQLKEAAEEQPEVEIDEEAKKFQEYEESLKNNSEDDKKRSDKAKTENIKSENVKKEEPKAEAKPAEEKKEVQKTEAVKEEKKPEKVEEAQKVEEKPAENVQEKVNEKPAEEEKVENIKENKEEAEPEAINPFKYDDVEADEVSGYMNSDIDMKRDSDREGRPLASMFHDILEDFDEEEDVSDEFEGIRWWKIPLDDEIPISENIYYPYFCAVYHLKMAYPYINYIKYIKDAGHYYFGLKYDRDGEVKYVLYGIEGKNVSSAQPYMGMTGFIRWVKMKDRDKGMWIMYYNPHTGNIMIPKKR